ncbi:MAG: hypothetical protein ACLPTJ_18985 [Solirubrobacteraceae bacterium]
MELGNLVHAQPRKSALDQDAQSRGSDRRVDFRVEVSNQQFGQHCDTLKRILEAGSATGA